MGLRERLRRLERELERASAPTLDRYLAATRRETARRLQGVYESLARAPGNGPSAPHPGRHCRKLLADDTPEQAEADRRVVEAWEGAHGAADIRAAADAARAKLLEGR